MKSDILCDYKITNSNTNIECKLNVNDLLLHELPYELFEIEIKGQSCHASMPQMGKDAILIAS